MCITNASAQTVLTGTITDRDKKPVAGANVTYTARGASRILGFAISDAQGLFKLSVKDAADSLQVTIQHISFEQRVLVIRNAATHLSVELDTKTTQLKEVVMNASANPIFQKRDTINYVIDSLLAKQDRSVGDVIRKLPGVEIRDGRIYYQGKELKKYYVNGLDLMGNRYGAINENLPADAVARVQIIQNDQPLKILDSLVPSDQASLNLILKGKTKTTGTAKVGMGAAPMLWDVGVTPMTFTKKFQTLNSFKANNAGYSVMREFQPMISEEDTGARNITFLGLQEAGRPPFDEKRWLNNNVLLGSANFIAKTEQGLKWRGSITYANDLQRNESYSRTTIMTAGQPIEVSDEIRNSYHYDDLQGSLSIEKNEKDVFITNELSASLKWRRNNGLDVYNKLPVDQRFSGNDHQFMNKLSIKKKIGRQLVGFNSVVSFGESPQSLRVLPGQFAGMLNNGQPYAKLVQQLRYRSFYTNNSLNFIKGLGPVIGDFQGGVVFQQSSLKSDLATDVQTLAGPLFRNNIQFLQPKVYLNPSFGFYKKQLKVTLTTPVAWQFLQARYNKVYADSTRMDKLILNPSLLVRYLPSDKVEIALSEQYGNFLGDITQLIPAYILSSFNALGRSGQFTVVSGEEWNHSLYLKYQDPFKFRFLNGGANYAVRRNDFIQNVSYDTAGLVTSNLLPISNRQRTYGAHAQVSQYVQPIKSVFKLSLNWSASRSDQLVNNVLAELRYSTYSGVLEINSTVAPQITFGYRGQLRWTKSQFGDLPFADATMQVHNLEVNVFPHSNHMISAYADYYNSKVIARNENLFLNLKYTFTLPKTKTDLSVSCNNLLNVQRYVSQYNAGYLFVYSELYLRPRQVLATVSFGFK